MGGLDGSLVTGSSVQTGAQGTGSGGAGTINKITSVDGSIAVVNPTGSVTDLSDQLSNLVDLGVASIGSAETTLTAGGLNGNLHGNYFVNGAFVNASGVGPQNLQFLINGSASNLRSRWNVNSSSLISSMTVNSAGGAYAFSTGGQWNFSGILYARSGRVRKLWVKGLTTDGNNLDLEMVGEWTDTTTNLTSLAMQTTLTNGIGVGSFLILTPWWSNL